MGYSSIILGVVFLVVSWICLPNVSLASNVTPRYLMDDFTVYSELVRFRFAVGKSFVSEDDGFTFILRPHLAKYLQTAEVSLCMVLTR